MKLTVENNFKEQLFLGILIKNQNGQIIINDHQNLTDTTQYPYSESYHIKSCINSISCTYGRRIRTLVTNKNLRQTCLEESHMPLHQREYSAAPINKETELIEKYNQNN